MYEQPWCTDSPDGQAGTASGQSPDAFVNLWESKTGPPESRISRIDGWDHGTTDGTHDIAVWCRDTDRDGAPRRGRGVRAVIRRRAVEFPRQPLHRHTVEGKPDGRSGSDRAGAGKQRAAAVERRGRRLRTSLD